MFGMGRLADWLRGEGLRLVKQMLNWYVDHSCMDTLQGHNNAHKGAMVS